MQLGGLALIDAEIVDKELPFDTVDLESRDVTDDIALCSIRCIGRHWRDEGRAHPLKFDKIAG
ncbi:MAG: hypothetical protein ACREF7_02970 [Candidatus Saccharimonadales bacterium]